MEMTDWLEDLPEDADNPNELPGRMRRGHITCFRLWEYRQKKHRPPNKLTRRQKMAEMAELNEIMHCDDLNTREAEYVRGRLNLLRGKRRNGIAKCGHRDDPVMVQIRKIQRLITQDRKGQNGTS